MYNRRKFMKKKRRIKKKRALISEFTAQVSHFPSRITYSDFGMKEMFPTTCFPSQIAPLCPLDPLTTPEICRNYSLTPV
jgi:hypothetical protein